MSYRFKFIWLLIVFVVNWYKDYHYCLKSECSKSIVVATLGTITQNGAFVRADIKYIRVTNLDSSDSLQVGLDDESNDAAYVEVAADSSIIFTGTKCEGDSDSSTLDNATALKVKGSANQQLELFIASV